MTPLRCVILLQFATAFALGQVPQHSEPSKVGEQPEEVVRRLYHEVVARHPLGIPHGEDRKRIVPYLSQTLISRLDTAKACEKDYFRLHQDPDSKPPFDWLEFGLFSGAWEQAQPGGFRIDKAQPEQDGFFRVYLMLRYADDPPPFHWWRVAVFVARENGHFVVDDIIYLKDEISDSESRISQILTRGCDGSRWVGYPEEEAR